MVQQPKNLAEAKQIIREERTKVRSSISRIAGSRWLLAILASLAIAFGTHLAYAPTRLPPIANISVVDFGIPTDIDFGWVGEQATELRETARSEGVPVRVHDWIADNPPWALRINAIGFGLALVLLLINMTIMTKRRRVTRG